MNTSNTGYENARSMAGGYAPTIRSLSALALTAVLLLTSARAETVAEREAKFAAAEGIGLAQITLTGEVLGTDVKKRELTVTETFVNRITLKVDESVPDLEKLAVGDTVKVVYFISGKAEIRKPTAEEQKTPFAVLETSDLPKNPFRADVKTYKVVTAIDAINSSAATVTFKGIHSRNALVKLKDAGAFEGYKAGDAVVVTYTEPIVGSLEKITPAKK
jgi:hypothetical protein